jgi:hypothetical protein
MALVMGMMVCVRSWGGRCRRRHSEIAKVVSVTGVHMSSDSWSRSDLAHM